MRRKIKAGLTAAKIAVLATGLGALSLTLSYAQSGEVIFYGPLSRVITPNGDGINDFIFFCFENPSDADINGKIYNLFGNEVATIASRRDRTGMAGSGCPASVIRAQYSTWNGTSTSTRVRSGVYVYRIASEDKVFSGTVFVSR
jgi:hypothetical protein